MSIPRVLIVDDDPALLEALPETLRLRMETAKVDTAASGTVALERIRATDYDAIVADIRMPGMDGLALLDEIRILRPETPTLLITGHGEHDLAVEALRRGAYDYIQKPIDRDYFVISLRRAIERRQLGRQVEDQRQALERHATDLEERVRALTEIAAAIHQARGVREVLQSVASAGTRLIGATVFAGVLRGRSDPGTYTQNGATGGARQWEIVSSSGEILSAVDALRVVPRFDPAVVRVKIPIITHAGQTLGAIFFRHHENQRVSRDLHPQIEALTRQAAVALENALHYERQRGIAETLQRSLLPAGLPEIPGFAVAARYFPSGGRSEVGGDWYDVISTPSGQLMIAIGDVAGRGIQAAALMGSLRNALRAFTLEGHPPALAAERLNLLIERLHPRQMATLLCGVVDLETLTFRLINAGHLPPLMIAADGQASYVEGVRGVPLGTAYSGQYREFAVSVEPGTTLLLYTDGLVEDPKEPVDAGLARLRAVAEQGPREPEALCDHVLAALMPEGPVHDDLALLVLHIPLSNESLHFQTPARPESLSLIRAAVRRWLKSTGVDAQTANDIIVACGEASANVVQHAYGLEGGPLEVTGTLSGDSVELTVRDSGRWRPPGASQGGRGMILMRALVDSVEVHPSTHGTEVRLRRHLQRVAPHG